jgi:Holliday junction resolvase RusA-like endonuclease
MKLSYNKDEFGGVFIGHKPQPKPRMTRSDKWKKRPIVERYYAYCNVLKMIDNLLSGEISGILRTGTVSLTFFLPIPKSRKNTNKEGDPHQGKPDLDNYVKAVLDAICDNDSHVYELRARKQYTEGKPGIYINTI